MQCCVFSAPHESQAAGELSAEAVYFVKPEAIEFWQAGEFRLHDRFVYRRNDGGRWVAERLSP